MRTWPKHFPTMATARPYERNPEKLANFVYANRLGNGHRSRAMGIAIAAAGSSG